MKIGAYHALLSELSVSRYLNTVRTSHPGSILVRQMLDEFEVTRRGHRYQAIVYAPLAITLRGFRKLFASQSLSVDLLKLVLQYIFIALDFLHTDARVIHTGKSPPPTFVSISCALPKWRRSSGKEYTARFGREHGCGRLYEVRAARTRLP